MADFTPAPVKPLVEQSSLDAVDIRVGAIVTVLAAIVDMAISWDGRTGEWLARTARQAELGQVNLG